MSTGPRPIDVRVPAWAWQQREVSAFRRYCILRFERELGERHARILGITPPRVRDDGTAHDTLGIFEAMCRIERRLRVQGR